MIEAQAYAVQTSVPASSQYTTGDRVFHQKFGYGRVTAVEGNKLVVAFDMAGEKRVIDSNLRCSGREIRAHRDNARYPRQNFTSYLLTHSEPP